MVLQHTRRTEAPKVKTRHAEVFRTPQPSGLGACHRWDTSKLQSVMLSRLPHLLCAT